ncbi:collagen alpha-1(I) chain-like [Dromaius novaehollandiae]|uniref:collagen alpha-1(I) chain-like n=1 Tax=Dromaius novaehollandiae TaxID=8790 RepID=UPI00311FE9DF
MRRQSFTSRRLTRWIRLRCWLPPPAEPLPPRRPHGSRAPLAGRPRGSRAPLAGRPPGPRLSAAARRGPALAALPAPLPRQSKELGEERSGGGGGSGRGKPFTSGRSERPALPRSHRPCASRFLQELSLLSRCQEFNSNWDEASRQDINRKSGPHDATGLRARGGRLLRRVAPGPGGARPRMSAASETQPRASAAPISQLGKRGHGKGPIFRGAPGSPETVLSGEHMHARAPASPSCGPSPAAPRVGQDRVTRARGRARPSASLLLSGTETPASSAGAVSQRGEEARTWGAQASWAGVDSRFRVAPCERGAGAGGSRGRW